MKNSDYYKQFREKWTEKCSPKVGFLYVFCGSKAFFGKNPIKEDYFSINNFFVEIE